MMRAMELSPQAVAAATFKIVKRGYDPDEVRSYLVEVSSSLESSQQQATAMEARARAAIAKLQDASHSGSAVSAAPISAPAAAPVSSDDTENISRTLLLAQRTADATVTDAQAEAAAIRSKAEIEATTMTAVARADASAELDRAQVAAKRLVDEAAEDARRARSDEHIRAEAEYAALVTKRDSLLADVEVLERHVAGERSRVRDASVALKDLAERVPAGLAPADRPELSSTSTDRVSMSFPPLNSGQVPIVRDDAQMSPPSSDELIDSTPPSGLPGSSDGKTPPSGIGSFRSSS